MTAGWTRRARGSIFVGVGAGLAIVFLLVVQSLTGGILGTRIVTSTTTVTTASTVTGAYDQVAGNYLNYLSALDTRNISALTSEYERNATIEYTGNLGLGGLAGNYTGLGNISILLRDLPNFFSNYSVSNESQTIGAEGPYWVVNSSFNIAGNSPIEGNINATIAAQYRYADVNGTWLIATQTWNFLKYYVQFPVSAEESCLEPDCPQSVQNMSISEDGNYLAAGSAVPYGGNGSVYLVSLQGQTPAVLWRHVTDTFVSSVAISSNGSYVAAGGFVAGAGSNAKRGHGEIFLLNHEGTLLWNVSAGSRPQDVGVAIAANGSRIAADYGSGMLYLNAAGDVLWNYTFPQRGTSDHFAMSNDGRFIAYADENITLQSKPNAGWGIFYVDSHGHQLWNYTQEHSGVSFVQMSNDGSSVAASSTLSSNGAVYNANFSNNGTLYYFNGKTGAMLWEYTFHREQGYVPTFSLAMSSDGSQVSLGGPAEGVLFFSSSGKVLWQESVGGAGAPVSIFQNDSLVLSYGCCNGEVQLLAYNGTTIGTFYPLESPSAVAGSANGPVWASAGQGLGSNAEGCSTLQVFNGTTALPSTRLC
jgi:outer membrane protein assembly factor BamB